MENLAALVFSVEDGVRLQFQAAYRKMKPDTPGKFCHFLVVFDMNFKKKYISGDGTQRKYVKIMVKLKEFTCKKIGKSNGGVHPNIAQDY